MRLLEKYIRQNKLAFGIQSNFRVLAKIGNACQVLNAITDRGSKPLSLLAVAIQNY